MPQFNIRLVVLGLLAAVALAGCDAAQQVQNAAKRQTMMNNLKQLGIAYHNCHDAMQRGPQTWQEAEQNGLPAEVSAELQGAGYNVHWGVKMVDAMGGTSNFVAAYPSDAATAGGTILMLDGAVMQMTAQEFNDAIAKQKAESPKAMAAAEAAGGGGATAPPPGDGTAPSGPPAAPGY